MLHYNLDLCLPINRIHSIKFSLFVLKGEEEEKKHIPTIWHSKLPPAILWEQKGRGEKKACHHTI